MASEKNNSRKKEGDKTIKLELSMQQTASLALMFDMVLKGTGMQFQQPIYEIQQQIRSQLPPPPKQALKKV